MAHLARARVLIVEDSADTRAMYAFYFKHLGMEVETAEDAESALACIHRFHPDVIVMDIGLPNMPGDQLAVRLRGDKRTKHIRLIAVSGFGRDPSPDAAFDACLRKPCLPDDLARVVAKFV